MKKSLVALVFGSLVAMMSLSSCTRVDSGNEALRVDQFGNSKGDAVAVEVKGTVFYNPFTQDIFEYPNFMQHAEYEEIQFTTKDGSMFHAKPTFNYAMKKGRAVSVFLKYRKDMEAIQNSYMASAVQDAYVRVGNTFTADNLMANRADFENKMVVELSKNIGEDFTVTQLVSNMVPPQSLIDAINTKNRLVQEGLAEQNKVVKARAAADVKIANARGDSANLVITAAGRAEAMKLEQKQLSPLYIDYIRWSTWDGKLPVYGTAPNLFKDVR